MGGPVTIVQGCKDETVAKSEADARIAGDKAAAEADKSRRFAVRGRNTSSSKEFYVSEEQLNEQLTSLGLKFKDLQMCSVANAAFGAAVDHDGSTLRLGRSPAPLKLPTRVVGSDGVEKEIPVDQYNDEPSTSPTGHKKRILDKTEEFIRQINTDGNDRSTTVVKFRQFIEAELTYGLSQSTAVLKKYAIANDYDEYLAYGDSFTKGFSAPKDLASLVEKMDQRLRTSTLESPEERDGLADEMRRIAGKAGWFRDHVVHQSKY